MLKKQILKNLIIFIATSILFFLLTLLSNKVLEIYPAVSARISAILNPILGMIYGYPAIIACTISNFITDLVSGYGMKVAIVGLIPQFMYGFIPYIIWKLYIGCKSHIVRLDSLKKTIVFTLLMLVNSIIIGVNVYIEQLIDFGVASLQTSYFVTLNDFDVCMIFGLPLLTIIDFVYSKFLHNRKRKITNTEKIIILASLVELITFVIIVTCIYSKYENETIDFIWTKIVTISQYSIYIVILLSFIFMYVSAKIYKKINKLRVFNYPNGTILVDEKRNLEFLSYPYKNNDNINNSYEISWNISLSSQKGCMMKCDFCDCPGFGYYGNASIDDFKYQINTILNNCGGTFTKTMFIDFDRMGEPTFNDNILKYLKNNLIKNINEKIEVKDIIPRISTMCPKKNSNLSNFLKEYINIINNVYDGKGVLSFSINSTNESIRKVIYHNMALSVNEIANIIKDLPKLKNNKFELSFVISNKSEIDVKLIKSLFDSNYFKIKLSNISDTFNAIDNGFKESKKAINKYQEEFINEGFEVIIDDNDSDIINDGHLLLANISEKNRSFNKKRVGMIVAVEMDAIFKMYPNIKKLKKCNYNTYVVKKNKYDIYIVNSGMGISAASSATQYLISKYNVSMIINFGVVGGLTDDMKSHKICLVDKVVHYKFDCSEFINTSIGQVDGHDSIYLKTSENLVKNTLSILKDLEVATCASADKFVSTVKEKTYIHNTFNASICDMESAGIILTCQTNKVPILMLKAVADGLADGADGYFKELEAASLKCLKVADKIINHISEIEN